MRTPRLIVAMAALGALASGCSKPQPQAIEPKAARPVKTQVVTATTPDAAVRHPISVRGTSHV